MVVNNKYQKRSRKEKVKRVVDLVMANHPLMVSSNNVIYEYNGRFWEPIHKDRVMGYCAEALYDFSFNYYPRVDDIYFMVKERARRWVEKRLKLKGLSTIPWNNLKPYEVPFRDCVYNAKTRKTRPHRKDDFLETVFPIRYDPEAQCPLWHEYLKDCFGQREDYDYCVKVIEEFLGYILTLKAENKKSLFCIGKSNTGKSVLGEVMAYLVGKENLCSISVDKMNNDSDLAPIVSKALNIMSEPKYGSILADSGFKRLVSTGEMVQVNQKFKDQWMYQPFAKHVVFANTKPEVKDSTDAVFNRIILLEFDNVIPKEEQDRALGEKLGKEIEGIARRALKGLRRLTENGGQFTLSSQMDEAIEQYRINANPVSSFLLNMCIEDEEQRIFMPKIYEAFGKYYTPSKKWTHTRINNHFRELGCVIRDTSKEGRRGYYLIGYRLKNFYEDGNDSKYYDDEDDF